jgi:hypothetical protein
MDSVYGPWTGPGWQPAAFERTAPRYLWTDAFGVANYLTQYRDTQQDRWGPTVRDCRRMLRLLLLQVSATSCGPG